MKDSVQRLIGWILLINIAFLPSWSNAWATPVDHPIEQAKRATVGILQSDQSESSRLGQGLPVNVRGSGLHIGQGVIVTARHAVERAEGGTFVIPESIQIVTDDLRELPAARQGANTYLDVAVYRLQASESDWPPAHIVFSESEVTYGDPVFTVGYPLRWGPAITFGTIGNPNT